MAGRYGHRNCDWNLDADGFDWNRANLGMLMDIRAELKKLNALLACPNFTDIPHILRVIRKNTTKPRKRKQSDRASKP
jgi:hypothetical protein